MRPFSSINSSQSKINETGKSFRIMDSKKLRLFPQQMIHDKEQLYEDNLRLKQQLLDLQFKYKKEKQEQANYEKMIAKNNEGKREFQLIAQQRSKIKEQSQKLNELEEQILSFKRDPERTKRLELKAELEEMRDSYQKLQLMITSKSQQDQNETQVVNQSLKEQLNVNLLQSYKQDNINLSMTIMELQQQNQQLNNQLKIMKTDKDRISNRVKELEKTFENMNKHMQYMRQQVENSKRQVPQEDLVKKIEDLQEQNSMANKIIVQQKKQIEELEIKMEEMQHNFDIYKSVESKEKEKLQDRINILKKQIDDLQYQQEDSVFKSEDSEEVNGNSPMKALQQSPLQSHARQSKILFRVNLYEIENIISRVKLQMIAKNIPYKVQEQAICDDIEEEVSLEQMMQRLQEEPFVLSKEEALLVGRYIIEDNTDDQIIFNEGITQSRAIIKSVYRRLLGEYELFSEEEKGQFHQFFSQLFNKYMQGMESAIKQSANKKKHLGQNNCDIEDINEALKYCDIILNNRQRLYLDLCIFQIGNDLGVFNYSKLFEQFKLQQEQNDDQ